MLALLALALCADAGAQAYPAKAVRWIVPYPPGGSTDVIARTVGQKVAETWNIQVIIDNRPGASGMIGTDLVAKSAPDGYTLVSVASSHVLQPSLYRQVPFHTINDFTQVVMLVRSPNFISVHPSLPVRSIRELVALGLRALAVTSKNRYAAFPDVPTLDESGFPGFDSSEWWGLLGPAGMPRDIATKLNAQMDRVMNLAEVQARFAEIGTSTMGGTPEQAGAFFRSEMAKWAKVAKAAGLKPE